MFFTPTADASAWCLPNNKPQRGRLEAPIGDPLLDEVECGGKAEMKIPVLNAALDQLKVIVF